MADAGLFGNSALAGQALPPDPTPSPTPSSTPSAAPSSSAQGTSGLSSLINATSTASTSGVPAGLTPGATYDVATVAQMTGLNIADIQTMIDYYNRTNGASLNLDQLVNQYLKTSIDAAVYRILDYQYQQATGHSMDNALMGQIRSAVLGATPQVQQDLQAQLLGSLKGGYTMIGGSYSLTSIVGNLGFLAPLLANTPIAGAVAAPSDPAAKALAAKQNTVRSRYMDAIGGNPTADQVNQMAGMDQVSLDAYLNQQTVAGTHLNYGQYSAGESLASGIWKQYFSGAPTKNDITMMAGMNSAQAHAWAMKQPSYIPGVTVGDSVGIGSAAAGIAAANWNIPASPSMIQAIAQHVQGQNPAPTAPPKAY